MFSLKLKIKDNSDYTATSILWLKWKKLFHVLGTFLRLSVDGQNMETHGSVRLTAVSGTEPLAGQCERAVSLSPQLLSAMVVWALRSQPFAA